MFKLPARTVRDVRTLSGIGLHSGEMTRVTLRPATAGVGLWVTGQQGRLAVHVREARAPGGATVLGAVRTVEHLLSAVVSVGITDLEIEVRGSEIPAVDGSARPWVELLGQPVITGTTVGFAPTSVVRVEHAGGWGVVEPADHLSLAVHVDFPSLQQSFRASDLSCVQDARTFLFHRDLDRVRAAGLGKGVRPGGAVVWGERGPLVPLRHPDEPARHKMLDLLGDLALLGRPLRAHVEVYKGSHALHQELVRRLADALPQSRSD
jgi:UDP-3-O-[3-hydroxymyristoyl] N-acetylglucosamine deacetylase